MPAMRPAALALSILKNRLGGVPRPSWCTYLVCYRCNARCQMCDSWRVKPGSELTPEQVASVFAKIGRLDVVRLTGGEPFLREDMVEIAGAVLEQARPGVIHVTTNGSFPERIVDFVRRFARPRLLRFMVSFDGGPAEHDRNRGAEVTFETALESVRRLVELRSRHGLEVSVNHTVITPQSLADNRALRRLFGAMGVEVHSVLAYADSAMYGAKLRGTKAEHLIVPQGYPLHPALRGADVLGFVDEELSRVGEFRSAMLRHGKRYYLRGLRARLMRNGSPKADAAPVPPGPGARSHPGAQPTQAVPSAHGPQPPAASAAVGAAQNGRVQPSPPCVALRSHIRLLPDGGVPVCQFNTERVGNLLTHSFEEVWHGAASRQSRAWVDACPGCWAECEVMPNAIYSGDILWS